VADRETFPVLATKSVEGFGGMMENSNGVEIVRVGTVREIQLGLAPDIKFVYWCHERQYGIRSFHGETAVVDLTPQGDLSGIAVDYAPLLARLDR
jgi:hypothetical protein